ncbi:MAG: IclR family transcriptional regulator [Chloroflexota bacterium]|nr:IclR family transcriptional regulator [Chloroflexota bacterium]MDE3101656.1 IclR family transcriptional regulator [Chloroflexota bacterium]
MTAPRRPAHLARRRSSGDDGQVRSVARAIDVLFALEPGRRGVADIARATGLSAITVRRLLASLADADLVTHDPTTNVFMLGTACFGILDAVIRTGGGLGTIAGPVLRRVSAQTEETVALYVRAGSRRICAAQVPSPQPVRFTARPGLDNPIHTGSMGKVLLAYSEPAVRDEILDHLDLTAYTDATITDRAELERELRKIRRRGHAESRGERSAGVASASVPVFGPDGSILAALAVLGPSERLSDATLARIRPHLVSGGREITSLVATEARRRPA